MPPVGHKITIIPLTNPTLHPKNIIKKNRILSSKISGEYILLDFFGISLNLQ